MLFPKELQSEVRELLDTDDKQAVNRICAIITASEDLLTLNNLLSRYYHDGKQVKDMYHKLKPSYKALRKLANGTKWQTFKTQKSTLRWNQPESALFVV